MKHLKRFNESNVNEISSLDKQISNLLVGKQITATDNKLHEQMPYRIKNTLKFPPKEIKVVEKDKEFFLFIYVPMDSVLGEVYCGNHDIVKAKCLIMTSWIYWQIVSKIRKDINVLVYPNSVEKSMKTFWED